MKRYVRKQAASVPLQKTAVEKQKTEKPEVEKAISVDWNSLNFGEKLASVQSRLTRLYRQGNTENTINGLGKEDVLSEVVLNLLETKSDFAAKSENNMKRYLLGSVKNSWINLNKASQADSISLDSLKEKNESIHGHTTNMESILFALPENDDMLEHIKKRLAKSNKLDCGLFVWYYQKRYTLKEISERINKPIKTIHDRLTRIYVRLGKMKLREYWASGKELVPVVGGINRKEHPDTSNDIEPSPISWLKKARREGDPARRMELKERFRIESEKVLKRHHAITLNAVPKDVDPASWKTSERVWETVSCKVPNRDNGEVCYIGDRIRQADHRIEEELAYLEKVNSEASAWYHRVDNGEPYLPEVKRPFEGIQETEQETEQVKTYSMILEQAMQNYMARQGKEYKARENIDIREVERMNKWV